MGQKNPMTKSSDFDCIINDHGMSKNQKFSPKLMLTQKKL